MLGDRPGEAAVGQLLRGRLALRHHLEHVVGQHAIVARLDQPAAGDRLRRHPAPRRIGKLAGEQQAQVLLRGEQGDRLLVRVGGDHHLGEDAGDRLRGRGVERAVERDDPAERRHRIAGEGCLVSLRQRRRARHAAGIGVLDDDAGRRGVAEFAHQLQRRVGVVEVVVAQFLALHLPRLADAGGGGAGVVVEGGLLMRVLAIAQHGRVLEDEGQGRRELLLLVGEPEPARDHGVIGRGRGEGLGGEPLALDEIGLALRHRFVIRRIGDDRDIGVILRRRAHHRRAADVDILDDLVAPRALRDRLDEGIEVHHHQVDRADLMLGHRGGVGGVVAHRQQPAVDHRVQRLDAPVHHLGKAGEVGHVAHRQPRLAQRLRGAAGRHQLHAAPRQRAGEIDHPRLVGNGKERALDRDRRHVGLAKLGRTRRAS